MFKVLINLFQNLILICAEFLRTSFFQIKLKFVKNETKRNRSKGNSNDKR